MNNQLSLIKRIRRRILARDWDFFAVTAPGLEVICRNECNSLSFFNHTPKVISGGLEFSGRVPLIFKANLFIRTANRIMMRIGKFKASNFRQLEKKLSNFPWELFLKSHHRVKVKVSSRHSRLYHSDAVRFCIEGVLEKFSRSESKSDLSENNMTQTVYVRIVEDQVTLSLDGSGEILYKRGIKTHGGKAPIRETLACAALLLAGYKWHEPLIDPMCGSGTFSLEAAMIARNIPPGWYRQFAFMHWPCFRPPSWEFIRREAEARFVQVKEKLIFASDIDQQMCRELRECVDKRGLDPIIQVSDGCDFFSLRPENLTHKRGLVVLNPPYGLRMATVDTGTEQLYLEIFKKLKKDYKHWKVALIVPKLELAHKAIPMLKIQPFFHGGIRRFFMYGTISS